MIHDFEESPEFDEHMPFGEVIRKKRRLMGFNQADFGYTYEIEQGTVSRWEVGKTSPPIEVARELLDRLGFELLIREKEIEQ